MADEEIANEEGGGSKKMLIIIIAVVVLLAGGGAAFFLLSGGDEPPAETIGEDVEESVADAEQESGDPAEVGDAFYVGMPRPFVFNVPGYGRDRLVQIKVQLLVRGGEDDTATRKHIPLIEDTLLQVFSASNAEKLATFAGKQELRADALEAVQKAMEPIVGKPLIEKVLFIGFVMQ